jgi:phosphoglycerol transferase MdoB-like AlkP superfamily enzyme
LNITLFRFKNDLLDNFYLYASNIYDMYKAINQYFIDIRFKGNIYVTAILNILIVYGLFTICRILFYLFNTIYFPNVSLGSFTWILVGGLKFDTTSILYTNLLYLVFMFMPLTIRYNDIYQKILKYLFFVTNIITLGANCADFIYFRFTLRRTTATVFKEFEHETNFVELILKFIVDYWFIFAIWIVLSVILVLAYQKVRQTNKPKDLYGHLIYFINGMVLFAFLSGLIVAGLRGGFRHSTRPITLNNAGEFVREPLEIAIVLNTPFAIYKTLEIRQLERINFFESENLLASIYSPEHRPTPQGEFRPLNVVIIILESTGREYIGRYNPHLVDEGYRGYTPFIDSLIDKSLMFRHSFSNGRKSIDVLPAVFTSIPMMVEPYVTTPYSTNKVNSFASLLKPKGYHTSFFHGAPNGSMGFLAFTNMVGFEHYFGMNEYGNTRDFDGMWGVWDEEFFQFFAQKINEFPQPFFTSIFSVSSHHPFRVPERYEGVFPKGTLPIHQCIGYTDFSLKRFFETASTMPWFKNTLFVITADHPNVTSFTEYRTSLGGFKVPIIFYTPDGSLSGVSNRVIQHIDLLPTILGYLNYDQPFFAFGSNALDPDLKTFAINYTSSAFQILNNKTMLLFDGKTSIGAFDYRKDSLLKNNILSDGLVDSEKMEELLRAFIQQYNNRMIDDRLMVGE